MTFREGMAVSKIQYINMCILKTLFNHTKKLYILC